MKMARELGDFAMVSALQEYAFAAGIAGEKKRYLFDKLRDRINKRFKKIKPTIDQIEIAKSKAVSFDQKTGWKDNKKMHVGTYISFCLCILESYHDESALNISDILRQIMTLFEAECDWSEPNNWAGALAFERWEKVWE